MNKLIRPTALALLVALAALGDASAAVPADGSFYPFLCNGEVASDVVGDPVTGGSFRDIVGNTTYPAFYRAATATDVYFRMRVSGDPRKPGSTVLQPSSWDVLVDTDGNRSTYEFMLTADGNLEKTMVQWVRNSVQEPGNPMDPANDRPNDILADLTPTSDYWSVKPTSDGSLFDGDTDFFMTLRIPRATLEAAGLDLSTSFVVWGGTNAQNYSLNADFGCVVGMDFDLGDGATDPGPLDPEHVPDAVADEAQTDEETPVTTAVLANDSGLADAPIAVTIESAPAHGSVVVEASGSVTYTPVGGWNGTDAYTYRITDSDGQTDTATVTITVSPVNDAPVATDDVASGYAGLTATVIAVLSNDVDVDGDALSVSSVTQGTHGTVTIRSDGTVGYLPATPTWEGTDVFTYTVSDGALSGSASVTITIGPPIDSDNDGLPDWVEDEDGDGVVDPGETDPSNPDTDGDYLLDGTEDSNHNGQVDPGETDPLNPDTDGDGLLDGIEDANHDGDFDPGETDPLNPDTDGDGLMDGVEDANHDGDLDPGETDPRNPDTDGDYLLDGTEDSNHNGQVDPGETDPLNPDTDGDGLLDGIEDANHDGDLDPGETDPLSPDTDRDGLMDGVEDADHDGIFDPGETDPRNPDTDGDFLLDGTEDADHDGTVDPGETDPRNPDTDGDFLLDGTEDADHDGTFGAGETDPRNPDTDGDGLLDGIEDSDHDGTFDAGETDPRNPDTDGDGLLDGIEDANGDGEFEVGETNPLHPDTDDDALIDGHEDADHDGFVNGSETDPRIPDYDVSGGGCSSGPGGAGSLVLTALAALLRGRVWRRRAS